MSGTTSGRIVLLAICRCRCRLAVGGVLDLVIVGLEGVD